MGRSRREAVSTGGRAILHASVKIFHRERTRGEVAANLVESKAAVIAIARGILERLCHHRAGELLNLERKLPVAGNAVTGAAGRDEIEGERIAQKVEDPCVGAEPIRARLRDR